MSNPASRSRQLNYAVALVLIVVLAAKNAAGAPLEGIAPLLQRHCLDCHSGDEAEAGLDLAALARNLDDPGIFAKWERIHDRVLAGEMPPKDAEQPKPEERAAFVKSLAGELSAAHAARKGTVLRRLNRREYENTLNDLFGTNLKLAQLLPADGRSHEFENVGEALGISLVQMQRYLECIDAVLNEAIAKRTEPPQSKTLRASYADTRGGEQWLGKIWLQRDDGAVVFFKAFGYPTGMLREANVQQDGWYKVRITGYAYQSEKPITFSVGGTTFARGVEQPTFGYYALPPGEPTTIELKTWIGARYMIDILPYGISDVNSEIRRNNSVASYAGPGLAIQHVEIEGPLTDEFPSRGHKLVFDGLDRREIPPRNPRDRERPNYTARFEIVSDDPAADAQPVLTRVATRAFRRPVTEADVAPFLALFTKQEKGGATFEEALRAAVAAIFCSPDFLYLHDRPRMAAAGPGEGSFWLDDYSLAARLSYFLTRTAPDEELLAAAAGGKLSSDREALLAQAERLLAEERSERLVADFTDAWLNLRDIDFTNPDGILYPEFDPFLKWSMLAETRVFVRKLLEDNLGVANIVQSEFAMLNSRLAEHYGVAGVEGPEIRPVKLPPESPRGGLLSQGSVLKVSANGTNTSPVVRGVWVMDRILGMTPPPPPPGIPGVEPDIRGASTLRELLEKHRNQDNCRNCHKLIDPPGFALESFDPIGGWRERFRTLEGDRTDAEVNGMRVRYRLGPSVDASGQLPGGQPFAGFLKFRELLARDKAALAKALTTKLLVFATGREMGFSDRAEIDRIVSEAAATDYGVRDLVRLVVTSEIFRRK
jgi:hypothetical protein